MENRLVVPLPQPKAMLLNEGIEERAKRRDQTGTLRCEQKASRSRHAKTETEGYLASFSLIDEQLCIVV